MKFFTKYWYHCIQNGEKTAYNPVCEYEKCIQSYDAGTMNIVRQLHLHDARLTNINRSDSALSFSFDASHTQATIEKVIFHGVSVEKDEEAAVGDFWAYEEVFFEKGKFRIGVLFETTAGTLKELEMTAETVSFVASEKRVKMFARLQDLLCEYKVCAPSEREGVLASMRECLGSETES